jgi:hypothetical protein
MAGSCPVGRIAVLAFVLLIIACGSHAESGVPRVDPLLALERDPQAALAAAKHPTYKATYEMELGTLGALLTPPSGPPATVSSRQTYVARPPDFRYDFSLSGPGVQFGMVAVIRGQDAYACVDQDKPGCFKLPIEYTQQMLDTLNVSPLDSMLTATKDMDATVLPREHIAGLDAACFRWRTRATASASPSSNALFGQLGDVKLEACFSADGVMLRTLTSAGGLFNVETRATSVSSTVTDADFGLPYPLLTAPFPIPTSAPLTPQTPWPTPTH